MNNQLPQEEAQVELQTTFSINNPTDCERLLYNCLKNFKDVLILGTDDELTELANNVEAFLSQYDSIKQSYKDLAQAQAALISAFDLN